MEQMECRENWNHVGPQLRSLNNLMMRKMEGLALKHGEEDATAMLHGWILGWLYRHGDEAIYQKDMEKEFRLSKPAVTSILKHLESRGCIKRESVDFDARLKRIILLPKGVEIHKKSFDNVKLMEEILKQNISEEDLETFFRVTNQMKENILNAEKK